MFFLLISIAIVWLFKSLFKSDPLYYNGPKPSKEEQNANQHWIADHIQEYPTTSAELQKAFPKAAARAMAHTAYEQLERMRSSGKIDEIDYQRELEKILPLIDIGEVGK